MSELEFTQQLDRIRRDLIKEGYYYGSPNYANINEGFCGVFSSRVIQLYGDKVELCCSGEIGEADDKPFVEFDRLLPAHYFIKFNGKYYDAECIKGVKDHLDLPLFNEHKGFWRRWLRRFIR